MISAVMARMDEPTINLAAFGGVVFPVSLIIEAPVLMLLSASTALSKDWASYQKIRQFMLGLGFSLTILHILLAFTPLFDVVIVGLISPPTEIIEPARIGLMVMLPWSWTVAYRRFNQGVLIRFGRSKAISVGALLRIGANAVTALAGWALGLPGVIVGTVAIIAGVIADAVYTGIVVRPVIEKQLKPAPTITPTLTWPNYLNFYWPLAVTSLMNLIIMPMGSAAVARMPEALNSLAVWPVLTGFLFMWRSIGFAYNEVVVAKLDEPGSYAALRRFTLLLISFALLGLALVAATPLSGLWFVSISGLNPDLSSLAQTGLWVALLWPPISILRNTFQGVLVNGRKTKSVTESVIVFFLVTGSLLFISTQLGRFPGLFLALVAFQFGYGSQAVWLWFRSRNYLAQIRGRDVDHLTGITAQGPA